MIVVNIQLVQDIALILRIQNRFRCKKHPYQINHIPDRNQRTTKTRNCSQYLLRNGVPFIFTCAL